MIITMLGTNGWFDTDFGQTMCTLIRTRDYSVILDAGYGIRRIKDLVDFSKPIYLLLSHLHLDHTIGLHTLDYFHFQLPVKIRFAKREEAMRFLHKILQAGGDAQYRGPDDDEPGWV